MAKQQQQQQTDTQIGAGCKEFGFGW